jgi:hypothetical protein
VKEVETIKKIIIESEGGKKKSGIGTIKKTIIEKFFLLKKKNQLRLVTNFGYCGCT